MDQQAGAQMHALGVNYRSSPELIASLNTLFGGGQLFPPERGIVYAPVDAAPASQRKTIVDDRSGRDALTIVETDAEGDRAASACRQVFATFAAREIHRLLTGPAFRIRDR